MKYENYLIEEEKGLAYYVPKIQAECKPFLKDIRNAAGTLFRDDTKNRNKPIWKKVTRTDRRPLDTHPDIHIALDDWFLEKFGWRARSAGLFCWPLTFTSQWIQDKWLVFPAGKYKYIWSDKVDDLWASADFSNVSGIQDNVDRFIELYGDSYTDKNLKKAMKWGGEVIVNCKYSYLARAELMEPLNEMLGLRWQGAKYKGRKIVEEKEKKRISAAVLMSDGEKFLASHLTGDPPNRWEVPKGNIDTGENSKQAAVREFYEETGQKIDMSKLRKVGKFPLHSTKDVILFTYSVDKIPPISSMKCLSTFRPNKYEGDYETTAPEVDKWRYIPVKDWKKYIRSDMHKMIQKAL